MKKNKTLAQLKRDVKARSIEFEMIAWHGQEVPERLQGRRKITKAGTTKFWLSLKNGGDSYVDYPKAKLMEYTDNDLVIYELVRKYNPETYEYKETGEIKEALRYKIYHTES